MNPGDNWVEVNTPFYDRSRDLHIGNWFFQPTPIALGLTGIVAAALVIHGFGMKKTGRMDGGAPFEEKRAWDASHPDRSIGQYQYAVGHDPVKMQEATKKIEADNVEVEITETITEEEGR